MGNCCRSSSSGSFDPFPPISGGFVVVEAGMPMPDGYTICKDKGYVYAESGENWDATVC